jgi:hypothetical protein
MPTEIWFRNLKLAENHIGLTGTFARQPGDSDLQMQVYDSSIFGTVPAFRDALGVYGCPQAPGGEFGTSLPAQANAFDFEGTPAAELTQERLNCRTYTQGNLLAESCDSVTRAFWHVGILLPIVTNMGKTCEEGAHPGALDLEGKCTKPNIPDRGCAMPWEKRYGIRGSRYGKYSFDKLTICDFYPNDDTTSDHPPAIPEFLSRDGTKPGPASALHPNVSCP